MKMVEKKSHNLMKNFIAGFIAVALLVLGVCFCATDSGLVMASDSKVKTEDGGYAVKTYSATDFAKFRGDKYTYPKLTAADRSDYQEWLFAGWFTDETCKTSVGSEAKTAEGNVYAKFVDADLSYIKCQVTPETDVDSEQAHMRVISTVDSKYYSGTGFYITYKGHEPRRCATDNVYRRLSATDDGMECAYSPIAFNEHAEYLFALRLTDIGNTNFDEAFYIQSYWVTLDGTEVLGMSRYARIEDSYEKIVNVPVRLYASDVEVTSGSVSVSYDANQFSLYTTDEYPNGYDGGKGFTVTSVNTGTNGKITVTGTADNGVAEGLFVNLRLQLKKDATLQSNTTFVVDEETFVNGETNVTGLDVSNVIFKNYPVAYNGNVDTSWYDGFENNRTFVISSAADLYGLASIVNDSTGDYKNEQFSGDTIILGSDITINTATLDPEADGWDATGASYIPWTPIGKTGEAFNGTFDGRGNTINGIYVNTTESNAGLFGVATNSTIQDLEIKNAYFTSSASVLGSIVGYSNNTKLMNIYSNAYVEADANSVGGMIGQISGASEEKNISGCWFDGTAISKQRCGGIVGYYAADGESSIKNSLVTGTVRTTDTSQQNASTGGIIGRTHKPTNYGDSLLEISSCIVTGTVTGSCTAKNPHVGGVIGWRQNTANLDITDVYTTTQIIGTQPDENKETDIPAVVEDAATLNGHIAYDTIKGRLSVLTSQVKDGEWAIREHSSNLKDGVPVPAAFADNEWIDVAWYYDEEKSDDEGETYSISTAEELYGFSAISQDYNFEGDTIRLANDITVNSGAASSWEKGTTTPARQWKPIGNSTTSFQGTFDGQKHFIKGIYVNATTQNVGLFGYAEGATIQDLQLINSYIHSTVDRVGGIAGYYTGDMYRVYCDAIVVSTRNAASDCGGLIGYYGKIASTDKISKCWFAGTAKGYTRTGGVVGYLYNGRKEISDTLVTGTIISTTSAKNAQAGGIVGSINDYASAVVDIKSSIGVGIMQDSYTGTDGSQIGGVVGYKAKNGTVTINNVYTTFSKGLGTQNNTLGTSAVEADYTKIDSIDDIKGSQVYTNDVMNLGYYLYDSTWVARTTDIPVPRCFVGTVVDANDIVEDTSAHTAWYDSNPDATEFEIKTENDFLGIAVKVDEGVTFKNKTIKLAKDMDLNRGWIAPETATEEFTVPDITWTSIGNNTTKFQGTFDGQGHEIKGIYASGSDYVGLFGYGNGATLKNFQLTNSYVCGSSNRVGSVIGCNSGNMTEIYSDALVVSASNECGGLIGLLTGTGGNTISKCWFAGNVQGLKQTGGIIGNVAMGTKTIQHCLVTGCVKTTEKSRDDKNGQTGGMIGSVPNNTNQTLTVTIESCLTAGDVADGYGNATCGGIIGYRGATNTVNITDVYTTYAKEENWGIGTQSNTNLVDNSKIIQIKDIDNIKSDIVYDEEKGIDLNYSAWIARKNNIPVPRCFVGSIVSETDAVEYTGRRVYVDTDWYTFNKNPYSIETVHELVGLAQLVNEGVTTFDNKTINLVKDIDFNKGWTAPATTADEAVDPANIWMPIGNSADVSFQGTFNGNGNTIRGIYVDENVETTYTGLFGYTKTCAVRDLRLENSYFSTTNPYMGSIIGYGNGTLTNVYSDAIMHSTKVEVGGLVGRAVQENSTNRTLRLTGCWFNGDIRVVPSAASAYVGGLVGLANNCDAIIDTCLYTGDITLDYTSTTITAPNTRSGGLFGSDNYSSSSKKTLAYASISNTISAGTITGIIEDTAEKINNLCTTIGQVRTSDTQCTNVYDMSVVTKVIGGDPENSVPRYGKVDNITDESKLSIVQTYEKEHLFGLGAQLLTNLDFVQDAEEAIWAARRGQIPAPAGLVANSDKLNIQFGKADTDIADGATGDTAGDPYIIENVEELYGFAVLSRTNNFAGKFIKLSDDIEDGVLNLNPDESAEDWAEGTVASLPWYSIGVAADNKRFAGHFDGKGKAISGIYMNSDNSYLGLFAATETGSTITNLRLTNSYINYKGNGTAYTGSVVGDLRGDMTEVYSDAIVNSNGTQTGGLIGRANEVSDDEAYDVDITNCWYDGQLTSSKSEAAGLIARANKGTVNVDNCLNTGEITTTFNNSTNSNIAAGVCSRVDGEAVVTITDTISAGKITDSNHGKNVKSVVGYIPDGSVAFEDVFATKTSYARHYPSKGGSGSYTGTVLRVQESDRFIGYCKEEIVEKVDDVNNYLNPKLEFGTNGWTIRTSDVPVPTCFADLVTPVTANELNTQIGLDYLNTALNLTGDAALTLENAVDMGEGNYVLNAKLDDTGFADYKSTLEGLGFGTPAVENVADRVHSVSYKQTNPDWVVTLTYVETIDALTISINTDTDSLSDKLVSSDDEITYATGDIKLTMLQMYELVDVTDEEGNVTGTTQLSDIYADLYKLEYLYNKNSYWYGNSFVFQVSEDHFVVNDGGAKEEYDDLINYMKAADGTTEDAVYIDAWIISHQHGDHADVLKAVADDPTLANGIYVDAFYISEPNAKVLSDSALYDDAEKQYYGMTLFAKDESGEQSDIYRMHTGQRYNFNGLVMDVIQTQDQIPYSAYGDYNANNSTTKDFNTASTVTLFSTATQKVLIGGDANYVNMGYIMKAYDSDETDGENNYTPTSLLQNINVFAAFHHGKNMSMQLSTKDTSFVDYLTYENHTFDHVLYPCSLVYGDASDPVGAFPYAGEVNTYLNSKANAYKHFGDGHVKITLGATTE